ncbi:hypothetical protein GCM10022421_34370 [Oceanisphaera sediminis]|uniref:Uncharacterized protein n=1 Tax=Oceanisphaera sediminis TaxID=981381 RepID=A0ABP7EST8_9GAMM
MSSRKTKRTMAVWESDQLIVVINDEGADSYISEKQTHALNKVGSDPA